MAENQESTEDVQKIISDKLEVIEEIGENPIDAKLRGKWGAGAAMFSFGFLSLGSVLFGATPTTSFLRGIGGAVLFGSLFWLVGTMLIQEETPIEKVEQQDK